MLSLTDTVLYLFGQYDATRKDVKKTILMEETKDFYLKIGALKEINYTYSLDLLPGITNIPRKLLLAKVLQRLETFGNPVDPLKHLLVSYANLSYTDDSYWRAEGLIPINPLSTAIYNIYLASCSSLLESVAYDSHSQIKVARLFSDFVFAFKCGFVYEDLQDSVKTKLLKFPLLQYKESLIERGQSTFIFPFGEKRRILSITKTGLVKVK